MRNKIKYNNYILSDEWKEKRELAFSHRGKACQKCGTTEYLQVHHGTYIRLYKENVADLFVLCYTCHKELHEKYGTKDLFRATKAFIKGEELKQKKKRNRMSLEERRKNRQLRKEIEIPMAINDIKNGIKFSKSEVQSLRNWRVAKALVKKEVERIKS